jgi:WD40 repeat protein
MWSLPQGRLLWSRDDVRTSFLALSKDGRYLATSGFTQNPNDKHPDSAPISTTVTLWDLATRTAVLTDKETGTADQPNTNKPRAIAFSPDSRLLAAGFFDPPVKIYDVPRHARRLTIDDAAAALTFTPSGKELLVKDFDGLVRGFDPRTGKGVESFRAPIGGYSSLAFSADGRWLVGSGTTSIYVWDAASRRVVVDQLPLPSDGSNDGLFLGATSDNRLFVGTQTSVVSLSMNPSDWNRLACQMAGRTLSRDEWARFLPGRPYAPACA